MYYNSDDKDALCIFIAEIDTNIEPGILKREIHGSDYVQCHA